MPSEHRVLRFPHRRSVGTLFVADESQPEEWELLSHVRGLIVAPENQPIKWTWLEEARGNVTIPSGVKVKLKISGNGSGSLAPLQTLKPDDLHTLDLSRSEIIDVSLSHIQDLSSLKVLELTATNVTDAALAHLPGLTSLQGLGLSHCQISGRGLIHLESLTSLRELWLSGADLIDEEMVHLQPFKNLVQLGLSSTRISDLGLEKLAPLKQLMRLYLFNTQVTRPGAENFRTIVPGCRVKWKARITDEESTIEDETAILNAVISESAQLPGGLLDILQMPIEEVDTSEKESAHARTEENTGAQSAKQISSPNDSQGAGSQNKIPARHAKAAEKHHQMHTLEDERNDETRTKNTTVQVMDEDLFWQIIESFNWQKIGNDEEVMEPAIKALSQLSNKDICAFADILSEKMHTLDTQVFAREIGNACYTGGDEYFSEKWFVSSRCCAIVNGREFFTRVFGTPQCMPKELEFDAVLKLAAYAYERKTQKKFAYLPRFNYETFANKNGWK
jgi:hypothetical protein